MSTFAARSLFLLVALFPALACAGGRAAIHRIEGKTLVPVPVKELLKQGPDQNWSQGVQVRNLGGNEQVSSHVVWIKTEEKLHTHAKHDATVMLLKGRGTLWFAGQEVRMKEGDVVTITRGIVHAFKNESKDAAAAYVVFTPPFDGKDVIEAGDVVR